MPFLFRPCPVDKGKKKPPAAQQVLDRLNGYLDAANPAPVYWLTRLWEDQQQAVTYKELREAILAGGMDPSALQAWQEDYAVFVNEHLQDTWTAALQEGAAHVAQQHPDFFFDPMAEAVQTWSAQHGAQWVTLVSDEQRSALAGLIGQGASGAFGVDELSRAIRPLIGLTKPQAEANLRYYRHMRDHLLEQDPAMKKATAEKRAREKAMVYAARQHRRRAYNIAVTELAYAYCKGADEAVIQAMEQGYMGKTVRVWSTAADEGVCPVCGALEGKAVEMDQEYTFPGKSLYGGQKRTPPAHPGCRCAVEYRELEPPVIHSEPEALPAAPEAPEPAAPAIPEPVAMPPGMKAKGAAHMGNTGAMYRYVDADGREWLFKPAQSKSGKPEAFRAYAQEAGYRVQYLVDPESAVPVGTGELGGKFGAFQPRIKGMTSGGKTFDLEWCQQDGQSIPQPLAGDLQREHVSDWLLGNYDAHGENFIMDEKGRIIGLDKEQTFKYIGQKGSKVMSYGYHPNSAYGETEPIYNTMYRRFAKGEMDLDLQDTLAYIKRVEAVPDAQYREIFRDYAEALKGKGAAAEELLDQIVERKATLRETYRAFYGDLLTERTGKKQVFVWADEAAEHLQQPLAAVQMTPDVLQGMKLADLKGLAQQKEIPYFHNMTKAELVTAVSDPVKAPAMSAQVKARLDAAAAARRAKQAAAGPAPAPVMRDIWGADDLFQDLSRVPATRLGVPVASDRDMVEGLNLTCRRMNIAGEEVYELSGKLGEQTWSATWDAIKERSEVMPLTFEAASDAEDLFRREAAGMAAQAKVRRLTDGASTFELYVHGGTPLNGLKGYFRVRVPVTASGAADAGAMRALLEQVDLKALTLTPDMAAQELLAKSRLLWQHAPGRVPELAGLTGDALRCKLDLLLQEERIDAARTGRMVMRKVFDGYSTLVEEGVAAEYQAAGAKYVWAGVNRSDNVVKVLQGPGFLSTNSRMRSGLRLTGASPGQDMATGGSDNVFTRLAVKRAHRFSSSYLGGQYRVIIDPKVLERTDWYAYEEDSFGTSRAEAMARRPPALQFIQNMARRYESSNEIMFRQGIPKELFTGISCENERLRAELLEKLDAAGIREINGKPAEQFIFVSEVT